MSPLARSLLALAALLAAADATIRALYDHPMLGSSCAGFIMDIPTEAKSIVIKEINFEFKSNNRFEVLHNITDHCAKFNLEIATERVEVCNVYPPPSMELFPPIVYALGDTVLSPVVASCENADECGPLSFHIKQKCRSVPLKDRISKSA